MSLLAIAMAMSLTGVVVIFLVCLLAAASAWPLNEIQPREGCTVTSYSKLEDAMVVCNDLIISGITVPKGATLEMNLRDGATVTFQGYIKFDYKTWDGPLVKITGHNITVQGVEGHSLDGQGSKYWDKKGGSGGKTKPKFFRIQATGGSVFKDINLDNCPKNCVSIGNSQDLTLSNWNIDVSAGTEKGKNTDGFDISSSSNIIITNSVVKNQGDCISVNQGTNMKFFGITCSGGHGLSLSVGQSKTDESANIVSNVDFSDCNVIDSTNGIHIKTNTDAPGGFIKNVTYSNIKLSGITEYAINIQEDYYNGGSSGKPKGNIPITDLVLSNVIGTMKGSKSMPVYILCGSDGCSSWSWNSVTISGNAEDNSCNYSPSGFSC